jgi:asparagine synthase (glutamine-hydrolysing)
MCGIAGAFGLHKPDRDQVGRTLSLMVNRGPDGKGLFQHDTSGKCVTLLHTRLAILDLDPRADQPFIAEDVALSYNGEIYNYLELKAQLQTTGHKFRTQSDTEVVLRSYLEWGTKCFDRFEGMWALALFDQRTSTLLLSRDRFGEKPLYYCQNDDTLYFASEVKALAALSGQKPSVNFDQIRRYLVNGYKSLYKNGETFFSNVSELPAATFACLNNAPGSVEAVQPEKYWSLNYAPQAISRGQALEAISEKLERALSIRLRADVPIAFCLSGGVDSTALVSLARRKFDADVHAFSVIDTDERYDEADNITDTVNALGIRHTIARTRTDGFIERLQKLIHYHDAPVATISYVVHEFLSQAIHDRGYKVAISGTAADELFTGYYDHYGYWLSELQGRSDFPQLLSDWQDSYGKFVQNPVLRDPMVFARDPAERSHIYLNRDLFNDLLCDPIAENFHERDYSASLLRNRMMNELFHETVPVLLHEDDLNSMKWSVENRSPFLDRSLAELVYSIPNEHLIHEGRAKSLLREAVAQLAPEKAMQDRRKRGFNASIDSMLDKNDPDVRDWLLMDSPIFDVVKKEAFAGLLGADTSDASLSKFMFSFVSAKTFLESELVRH